MTRAAVISCLLLATGALAGSISAEAQIPAGPGPLHPNVVLMFADNVGVGEVSA